MGGVRDNVGGNCAKGATAIKFGKDMELTTLNSNLTKSGTGSDVFRHFTPINDGRRQIIFFYITLHIIEGKYFL